MVKKQKNGFTLMELILTLSLSSIVIFIFYSFLISGERNFELGKKKVFLNSELNKISLTLSEELQNATLVSTAFGDCKVGVINDSIAILSDGNARYIGESIDIEKIELNFKPKASGELINYTLYASYKGVSSVLKSSILLNNISRLPSNELNRVVLSDSLDSSDDISHCVYFSKNYEIPKNYFESSYSDLNSESYKFGLELSKLIHIYDGFCNYSGSENSHTSFDKYIKEAKSIDKIIRNSEDKSYNNTSLLYAMKSSYDNIVTSLLAQESLDLYNSVTNSTDPNWHSYYRKLLALSSSESHSSENAFEDGVLDDIKKGFNDFKDRQAAAEYFKKGQDLRNNI